MIDETLFAQVLDYSNRSNPYPLYARLREAPVARQENGIYVVSGFDEIRSLLFDSRLSSKVMPKLKYAKTGNPVTDWVINPIKEHMMEKHRSLVFRDPPDHDILRRLVMLQFNPDRIRRMQERIEVIVDDLIARMRGRRELDFVAEFSYPLPVTVICEILGVPAADEQKFHRWAAKFADSLDPDQIQIQANLHKNGGLRRNFRLFQSAHQNQAQRSTGRRSVGPCDLSRRKGWANGTTGSYRHVGSFAGGRARD